MDPCCGKGSKLCDVIEKLLKIVAELVGCDFKTPPHDIAAWVVGELIRRR